MHNYRVKSGIHSYQNNSDFQALSTPCRKTNRQIHYAQPIQYTCPPLNMKHSFTSTTGIKHYTQDYVKAEDRIISQYKRKRKAKVFYHAFRSRKPTASTKGFCS
jgi:hypothetical protein